MIGRSSVAHRNLFFILHVPFIDHTILCGCAFYWVHPAEILSMVKLNDEIVKQIITSVYESFRKYQPFK
jgi:hypothetical protein